MRTEKSKKAYSKKANYGMGGRQDHILSDDFNCFQVVCFRINISRSPYFIYNIYKKIGS